MTNAFVLILLLYTPCLSQSGILYAQWEAELIRDGRKALLNQAQGSIQGSFEKHKYCLYY